MFILLLLLWALNLFAGFPLFPIYHIYVLFIRASITDAITNVFDQQIQCKIV